MVRLFPLVKCTASTFEEMELVTVPSLGMGRDPEILLAQRGPYGAALQARQHAAFRDSPNYRVDVIDSRHATSFTNPCEHSLVELGAGKITQAAADATLALFECNVPTAITRAEAHRVVTAYLVSFLDKIADRLDEDNGETNSLHLLRPAWAARHEPRVNLFVSEADGPEVAPRNLGSPFTFQYFGVPPDFPRKIKEHDQ
jgi:hypothetical protein